MVAGAFFLNECEVGSTFLFVQLIICELLTSDAKYERHLAQYRCPGEVTAFVIYPQKVLGCAHLC